MHLIYENPTADTHAVTIRAVDDGAPLVNGAIYEVSDAIAAELLTTGHWRKHEPAEQAEDHDA